ncbi:uncharacterized protein B0J16DRAFT_182398 [Fusarium flagelliforme]|uniref:Uncharacterized protein n=1 Tax=Fusarium flagelliforme TaxID=2675880 RepID=A0A395MFV2_9HYPO|nr:uncharacterized protein B0J16DRAFT_182398 [Fusarium flagelliforme]KAH7174470.1 hypothetical protein B0J16DRAFT_182398 [Fusarium flagelliforme]RFN45999.1 hypothetical protein FIE12Z_9750 [Fusarium flagelliforme]
MPTTSITSLLWPAGDNVRVEGEVWEAEATGTRYMLRGCKPNDDSCDHHTAFVEFGPWASETLSKGAAETGVYNVHGTVDGTMYSSVCEMSRSVIQKCTVSKASGFDPSTTEYNMTRTKGETGADFTLLYHEVSLTGGLSKLASATGDAAPATTSSNDEASSTNEASSTTNASSDGVTNMPTSATEIEASNTEATVETTPAKTVPTETTSAGSPPLFRAFAVLAIAGLATAMVM